MAISVGAVLALLILVLIGPAVHLGISIVKKKRQEAKGVDAAEADDAKTEGVVATQTGTDRDQSTKTGYVLGLLGYAIGIGNIWRFPWYCGKFGGFAFVFAYLIMLFLVSMPLFFAELALGQQTQKSTIDALAHVHPIWKGLGRAQGLLVVCVVTYYNIVIAWTLVYVGGCLVDPLPWAGKAESFWKNEVLNVYTAAEGGMGNKSLGPVSWKLAIALFFVMIANYFAVGLNKATLAKVTWVTVIGPLVLLAILLIAAVQLEGASDGLNFYLGKLEWSKLSDFKLWSSALGQILFSLSPGFGTAITLSSTAPRDTDVFKTMAIVGISNSAFSLISGIAVFSIIGNLAIETNRSVADIAENGGTGLAFIAIAEGMKTFGAADNIMSVFFFVMLFALGVDSSFAWMETVVVMIQDLLRSRGITNISKPKITGVTCLLMFLVGLLFCTRGGDPLLDIVDHYVGTLFLLFSCGLEAIALIFGYNFKKIAQVIEETSGRKVPGAQVWNVIMHTTMPLGPAVLFFFLLGSDMEKPYGGYATWLQIVGWILFCCCLLLALGGGSCLGANAAGKLEESNPKDPSSVDDPPAPITVDATL